MQRKGNTQCITGYPKRIRHLHRQGKLPAHMQTSLTCWQVKGSQGSDMPRSCAPPRAPLLGTRAWTCPSSAAMHQARPHCNQSQQQLPGVLGPQTGKHIVQHSSTWWRRAKVLQVGGCRKMLACPQVLPPKGDT